MAGPTLASLRTAFYNRFDEGQQNYIGVDEANSLINEGASHLYNWLVSTSEDYVWKEAIGTVSPSQTDFELPDDFFKILKVFRLANGFYIPVKKLMMGEWRGVRGTQGYMLVGNYLRLSSPIMSPMGQIAVWYVPTYTDLVKDTDTFPFQYVPSYSEFIINQAVIGARIKEESDTTPLERRQAQIIAMIETDMQNRDMGRHQHVVDNDRSGSWYEQY